MSFPLLFALVAQTGVSTSTPAVELVDADGLLENWELYVLYPLLADNAQAEVLQNGAGPAEVDRAARRAAIKQLDDRQLGRLRAAAEELATLPVHQRQQLRASRMQYYRLDPRSRARVQQSLRAFSELPAAERARLRRAAFELRDLPLEEQAALRKRLSRWRTASAPAKRPRRRWRERPGR